MQRAIYEGEHHQLGVIMAPDKHEAWAVQPRPVTLFHVIMLKLFTRRKEQRIDEAPLALPPAPVVSDKGSIEM
jgi:hypothetical protein